jgi:Fe-S-cluster-containing hydrogenase component 2
LSDSKSKPRNLEFTCIWKCGICISVCAENAISDGSDLFTVNEVRCSGCLACVRACPAGVIEEDLFA